jgi:anti-anti-sigma factor
MGFHFCAHAWEVRHAGDGTLVKLSPRDLDAGTMPVLVDELLDLVRESGQPHLYLDFTNLQQLPSEMHEKLLELNNQVKQTGGRLILLNVTGTIHDQLRESGITAMLEVRMQESGETIF